MKNNATIIKYAVGLASIATLAAGFALPASAATTAPAASLASIVSRSGTEISTRIDALNALSTRVQAMVNVSATEKASLASEVSAQTSALTTLKTKIDADTDAATARADEKTITADYRIYALVIPRGYVVAAADRVSTISSMMTALQAKLATRISTDQSAGKDVSSLSGPMTDITAKVSDATAQATTAQSSVVPLVPDQGNATVIASNKATLVSSRTDLKASASDLKIARSDIQTILAKLKALG